MMFYKQWVRGACALFALTAVAAFAAESYPARPVRVVVPFGAGGPDLIARIVAQQLASQLGQPVVVDNRPGANGIVGTDTVAKAAPDGHTLILVSASFVVNPSIYKKLPYDTLKDFAPVTNVCAQEAFILVVHPAVPAQNVQEFVALGRRPDNKLAYSSPGVGNTMHLAGALFDARAKTTMTHVPYKGGGPAIAALLGGEIQAMFSNTTLAMPHIRVAKLRALAVTGRTRLAALPEVPTLTESGVPGMEIDAGWFGLFAPAKTPVEIINRLHSEVRTALAKPAVRERLIEQGFPPVGNTPAQFRATVEAEIKAYAEMVRLAKIQPE
jgi:tripartite-type tricarboxylate transporter receptor subunit TctC